MTRAEKKTSRVAVALSGGVSSAVAAALLKSEGYNVLGVYLRNSSVQVPPICSSAGEEDAARAIAGKLDIPLHVEDVSEEFEARVIDPFIQDRVQGRRSSGCTFCMRDLLFPVLERVAHSTQCSFVATGHHANASPDPVTGQGRIFRGMDLKRDQSYWLYGLAPELTARLILPTGGLAFSMVEKLAQQFDLKVAHARPHVELGRCFEQKGVVPALMEARVSSGFRDRGLVRVSSEGLPSGEHPGLFQFSVGDLYFKAKPKSGQPDLYVLSLDVPSNALVVGTEDQLMRHEILADQARWNRAIVGMKGMDCSASFGPGQPEIRCHVTHFEGGRIRARFERPLRAPQVGRAIVFYEDQELLGGAVIQRTFDGEDDSRT